MNFFSLLNFNHNKIKVRFFFFSSFFCVFFHYTCSFNNIFNFSVLNNYTDVVVGNIFI